MHYRRSAAAVVSAMLLIGSALGLSSTASAAGTSPAHTATATTAPTGVLALLAVRAANGHAFTNTDTGHSQWVDLGGKLISTPAVAYSAATRTAYYVGVGTNKALFIRTNKEGWQPLVSAANSCSHAPSVKIVGSSLAVACTGSGSPRTYVGSAALPTNGSAPVISRLVDQGGVSASGPTLTVANGKLMLSVLSKANSIGNIYSKYVDASVNGFHRAAGYCASQIGETNDLHYLACENGNTARNGGNAYSLYYTYGPHIGVGGQMQGAAAAVANSNNSQGAFFVVARTGEVFEKNASQSVTGPWTGLGGKALPGIAATPVPQA